MARQELGFFIVINVILVLLKKDRSQDMSRCCRIWAALSASLMWPWTPSHKSRPEYTGVCSTEEYS